MREPFANGRRFLAIELWVKRPKMSGRQNTHMEIKSIYLAHPPPTRLIQLNAINLHSAEMHRCHYWLSVNIIFKFFNAN